MRILVADPDTASRTALAALVGEATAAEVVQAGTAAEARAAFDASVCLVIAQLRLPDATGLELWRSLRDRRRARDAVACLLVGEAIGEELTAEAIGAGADVVHAPVRPTELCARVRRALVERATRAASATRERRLNERFRRLERRRAELEQLVHVDALTGVINRRHLEELLDVEIRRAQRERDALALIVVDVDYFHELNEAVGHVEGDACLTRIARALASELRRPSDVVGRYGGDEFLVLLPHTDAVGGGRVAERLRRAVVRLVVPHDTPIATVVTISLGVGAMTPGETLSAADLFARADTALLDAKRLGRNRWVGPRPAPPGVALAAGTWPTPVRVDPTLYDRVPAALLRKQREIAALDGAGSPDALRVATDLKRLGRELGFREVVRFGNRLERAVRAGDSAGVLRISAELGAYLERVPVIYLRG